MRKILFGLVVFGNLFLLCQATPAQQQALDTEMASARKARDRGEVADLQKLVLAVKASASKANTAQAYVRLALLQSWLCEAAESTQNMAVFKKSAEDGIAAAEKAVALDSKSSEAHQLLGDLLNQLIPHIYGGGMRYGKRATDAMDKAIELNPRNAHALVSRAISLHYTPESFGGGKGKAIEMLRKAVEIDPGEDSTYIWLAIFYLDAKQNADALAAISEARKINPDRMFTNYVHKQVIAAQVKKPANGSTKN